MDDQPAAEAKDIGTNCLKVALHEGWPRASSGLAWKLFSRFPQKHVFVDGILTDTIHRDRYSLQKPAELVVGRSRRWWQEKSAADVD